MSVITILRYVAFGITLAFSVIVLGLSAHLTFLTSEFYDSYFVFAALAIASAGMSLILVPLMLIFGRVNKNSFPTLVAFELTAIPILWILWVATGAVAAENYLGIFGASCGYLNLDVDMACKETSAIVAFSFLTWLALMAYSIVLLVFAIIGSVRGHKTFTSSVLTTNFLAPKGGPANEKHSSMGQPGTLAPQFTGQTNGSYAPTQASYPVQNHAAPPTQGQFQGQYPQGQYPQGQQPSQGQYQPGAHPGVPQV